MAPASIACRTHVLLGVHAEHENGGLRRVLHDLPCGLQAIHAGESAVHDDHLRMKLLGQLDGFFAVASFADDFHIGFILEHAPETAPDQAVVIHEQYCDLLFHETPLSL